MGYNFEDSDSNKYEDYQSQLGSPEWRQLRKIILTRDKNTCLKCDNGNVLSRNIPYHYFSEGTSITDKSQFFAIFISMNDIKQVSIPREAFKAIKDPSKYVHYFHQIQRDGVFDLRLAAITSLDEPETVHWMSNGILEIHHTYYQQGLKPWEYPENSLQTLCWFCHEETHKTSIIPKKDHNGYDRGSVTPCGRCFGTGRLPQYSHVQQGICFKCNGARYIELMQKKY